MLTCGRKFSFTRGAVKCDFRTYIRRYTSPNENFEYGYPHSNALLQFELKLERCKPHKAARHPTKCDVINDVKLLPTVYRRIYCRKFLALSNQTSHYKLKCIRISIRLFFWAPKHMRHGMRFPTMWYVRPAKPQISLHMRAVWSEPLLITWIFYDC